MQIQIDNWSGYGTSIPTLANDANGREYLGWSVGEKAAFNFRLPESYVASTDLVLTFEESTPGQSKKHKWSIDVSRALDTAETVTEEVTSSASANTNTEATITLTSSGELNSVDLAVGDLISCVVSRVSASGDEDSNDIKIYATSITIDTSEYTESGCLGRVGSMIDEVRADFNDAQAERISNVEIIRWFNACLKELAQENLFVKETSLNVTADVGYIDLLDTVSDFVDAFHCRWYEDYSFMMPCRSWAEFKWLSLNPLTMTGHPYYWFVMDNYLYFYPEPSSTASNAIYLFHSYARLDLDCLSDYTPVFPASFDPVLIAFALYRAHSSFYVDSSSPEKAAEWLAFYKSSLLRLKRQTHPAVQGLQPYR